MGVRVDGVGGDKCRERQEEVQGQSITCQDTGRNEGSLLTWLQGFTLGKDLSL